MAIFPGRPFVSRKFKVSPVVTPPVTTTPNPGGWFFPVGPGGYGAGPSLSLVVGQSNALLFTDAYDAPVVNGSKYDSVYRFMNNFRAITNIPSTDAKVSAARSDFSDPDGSASLFSDTVLYTTGIAGQSGVPGKWLEPNGNTLTDPSTWANTSRMTRWLKFLGDKQTTLAVTRPIMILFMWDEYMGRLTKTEIDVFQLAMLEFMKRTRAACGARSKELVPFFFTNVAYGSNVNTYASRMIRDSWINIAKDASNHAYIMHAGVGDQVNRSGDGGSHITVQSGDRLARRMAVNYARWHYDNGLVPAGRDLSFLPHLGPTIVDIQRVSGSANKLRGTVFYDGIADDLVAPTGTPNYSMWAFTDNDVALTVSNMTRVNATTVEWTFTTDVSGNGIVKLDYAPRMDYTDLPSQWTDNFHLKTKPAFFDAIADMADVRMIFNRFGGVVTLGTSNAPSGGTGGGGGTTTPTTPAPTIDPSTQSYTLGPNPGSRAAGVQTMTFTTVNVPKMAWTRIAGPPNWEFLGGDLNDGKFSEIDTSSGTGNIAVNWTASNQLVKYWPAGEITRYKDTGPVTITGGTTVPAAPGTDRAAAHDFVKDLRLGVNLERDNTDFVTDAWIDDLVAADISHVRLYPYSNATLGFKSNAQLGGHIAAINRIMARTTKLKVMFELQDVSSIGDLNNSGTAPYLVRVCQLINDQNWDLTRFAVGHSNEMANAGNTTFNAVNNSLLDTMRATLKDNTLLTQSCGDWGSPDTLADGTLVLGSDKRRIYTWHHYEWDHSNIAAWKAKKDKVKTWADTNGVEFVNAEFNKYDANFSDTQYSLYPAIIDAYARGAGGGGTIWAFTRGSGWRINVGGAANGSAISAANTMMRSEIKTAMASANALIRTQTGWNT